MIYTYNHGFILSALILALFAIITYLLRVKVRRLQQHVFFAMLLNAFFCSLFNLFVIAMEANPSSSVLYHSALYAANILYFLIHNLLAPLFLFYIMLLNASMKGRFSRKHALYLTPVFIVEVLVLLNPLTQWFFYYDAQWVYHRGPAIVLIYLLAGAYTFAAIFSLIRYRDALPRFDFVSVVLLFFTMIFGVFLQLFVNTVMFELFTQSLTLLGLLVSVESGADNIDPVTGVLNANAFEKENVRYLRAGQTYDIVRIDFANLRLFTRLVDLRTGHQMLLGLVRQLRALAPKRDLYHYSTGNFAFILRGATQRDIQDLLREVQKIFSTSWRYDQMNIPLRVFTTHAQIPTDLNTPGTINTMMEYAPAELSYGVTSLSAAHLTRIRREADVERAITHALETRSLELYYQPIFDIRTGRLHAAEALARLFDDDLGYVPSEEFIRVAEKNGMITDIGNYVFEEACRFISTHDLDALSLSYVEVNLSLYQCLQPNLTEHFLDCLDRYNVPIDSINLEITETSDGSESELMSDTIRKLRRAGFTFSLDDFGTGYSNLVKLCTSHFENVKLDRSFLWDLKPGNKAAADVMNTVIQTAHSLSAAVIQEGIETEEQLLLARKLDIDYAQGYYFSRPLREDHFLEFASEKARLAARIQND